MSLSLKKIRYDFLFYPKVTSLTYLNIFIENILNSTNYFWILV
jgi:hypothetical protein